MTLLDLAAEKPVAGTTADANQIANGFTEIQAVVNALDSANFASGKIFDLAKLQTGAGVTGSLLYHNGTDWVAATNVKITHGSSMLNLGADVNLYRQAADVLSTDDVLASETYVHGRRPGTTGEAFRVGNDVSIFDVDAANVVNLRGIANADRGMLTFGSGGVVQIGYDGTNYRLLLNDVELQRPAANRIGLASGDVASLDVHKAKAFAPGTQALTSGVEATMDLDSTQFDNGSIVDLTNNRLVAPVAGIYGVYVRMRWSVQATSNGYRRCVIRDQAATELARSDIPAAAELDGEGIGHSLFVMAQLGASDWVEVRCIHTQGSNTNVSAGSFGMFWIGT